LNRKTGSLDLIAAIIQRGTSATDGVLSKFSDTDQLKCVLIDCWTRLSEDTLNRAIDQLQKKTDDGYQGKGAHIKFGLEKFCV